MPRKKPLAQFIAKTLTDAGWPSVEYDNKKGWVKYPNGYILKRIGANYHLNFVSYLNDTRVFVVREHLAKLEFPKSLDIRNHLYFRNRTGNYKLVNESQFKAIVNPFNKKLEKIKVTNENKPVRKFGTTLVLSTDSFLRISADANEVYKTGKSYQSSTENYLANLKSQKYLSKTKTRTTYVRPGEFSFLIDKLYLETKKSNKDFSKYLNSTDITYIESLLKELLKNDVFTDEFLTVLNEYFIKERLQEILKLGRSILSLGTTDLNSIKAKEVVSSLNSDSINQLEGVWQRYFEKYLLYLIFTYKKIFPKVLLKDIDGEKKYPDFIGINHYNGVDVIEIKTHLKRALVWDSSHKNFYFSPELSKSIVQTKNYLDAIVQKRFEHPEDQVNVTSFVEDENLYHPRGIIIISSKEKLTTKVGEPEKLKRDFTKLRNSLKDIEILTFDEVLNIADEYTKNIIPESTNV